MALGILLHKAKIPFEIYERASVVKPLGIYFSYTIGLMLIYMHVGFICTDTIPFFFVFIFMFLSWLRSSLPHTYRDGVEFQCDNCCDVQAVWIL